MNKYSTLTSGLIGQPMFDLLGKVFEKIEGGQKVYRFEIGDTTFEPYSNVVNATVKALKEGQTKYVQSSGMIELKDSIISRVSNEYGTAIKRENIAILPSNSVIDFAIRCLADIGDNVLIPDPGFPTYHSVLSYLNIEERKYRLNSNTWSIDADEIENLVDHRTKLIVINSPSNPTGSIIRKDELYKILEIAKNNNIYVLSDEVYSNVVFNNDIFHSALEIEQNLNNILVLDGFSKGFNMSGWRLGYVIGNSELIRYISLMFETIYSCTPPFIQMAGVEALSCDQSIVKAEIQKYRECRDYVVDRLKKIPNIKYTIPEGSHYIFIGIESTGIDDKVFCYKLLDEENVSVLPGSYFGSYGTNYIRLCFPRQRDELEEVLNRIERFIKNI